MGSCASSPDITIASPVLINCATWQSVVSLGSDHLPITIRLEKPADFIISERRTYINQKKADWHGFREFTNRCFSDMPAPSNVHEAERKFRETVTTAAGRYIPAGRLPKVRPHFPAEAAALAEERDNIRTTNPDDPRVAELNRQIVRLVNDEKREKWTNHLKTCNLRTGVGKLWSTVRSLSHPTKKDDRVAIKFADTTISDPMRCARAFCRQLIEHPVGDKEKRKVVHKLHNLPVIGTPNPYTPTDVAAVINAAKPSKAIGPDGISMLMLKHLGEPGVKYLTSLFNLSMKSLDIPNVWKGGRVIPILKPGKAASEGLSYRPISLLSPVAKALESLLLPQLTTHLPVASHQHGFRKMHSTTTALTAITTQISQGLNQQRPCQRTVLVALDLSKAFDTVSHATLFQDILQSTLPNNLKRWIANYLSGRQSFVEFRDKCSKPRRVKQGVPQGGVLSPLLFNFYLSKLPAPPQGIEVISYADDCTIMSTGQNIDDLCCLINNYLAEINDFFKSRNLQLSPTKSSATLFTTWTKEVKIELGVTVDGAQIPTVNYPKILGVTFDSLFTSSAHAATVTQKLRSRNKILKALRGCDWGKDKETLEATYKTVGRSVVNYAAPVWSPSLSDTQWRNIQRCQNAALRNVTGCLQITSESHLHEETKILPVREHNIMLSQQFIIGCHRRNHPNHNIINLEPPPRHVRKDLRIYMDSIQRYVHDPMDNASYAAALKDIHKDATNSAIASYRMNIVLGGHPPPIDESEKSLPRKTRVTLAQLRSGWSSGLNAFWSRIDSTVPNVCPACGEGPHDTTHLFNCPTHPTSLTTEDLWTHPVEVAQHLGLDLNAESTD